MGQTAACKGAYFERCSDTLLNKIGTLRQVFGFFLGNV
jgi:hypothetical protein